jgi:hypothetical protein
MQRLRLILTAPLLGAALGVAPLFTALAGPSSAEQISYARCDEEVHALLEWDSAVRVDNVQVLLLNNSQVEASFKRELTEAELKACEPNEREDRRNVPVPCYLVAREDAAVQSETLAAVQNWVDTADSDGVAGMPEGLNEVSRAHIQLQPLTTPNELNVTLFYDEGALGAVQEESLRMFYFDSDANAMVEIVAFVDTEANSVTAYNVDVSAFAGGYRHVGLFG